VHDNDGWYEWDPRAEDIVWGKITEVFKEFIGDV
jgi:hypothetical protein